MSIKAVMWARDQRLSSPQKVVLLILASHHNPKDANCFPSQDLLSLETGLSRRAVQIALKALEKSRHISVKKGRTKGQWAHSSYSLQMGGNGNNGSRGHAHEVRLAHAQDVRSDHSKKTAHGESGDHAHEVRTKGYIPIREEKAPTRLVLISGRAAS